MNKELYFYELTIELTPSRSIVLCLHQYTSYNDLTCLNQRSSFHYLLLYKFIDINV